MSTQQKYERLSEQIANSRRAKFGTGIGESLIEDAEKHLGWRFPPTYRWWLSKYGTGHLGGFELQGLFDMQMSERVNGEVLCGDIVDLHDRNVHDHFWSDGLVELLNYEGDEVYFFDISRPDSDGEYPIVCLESGSEAYDYAPCFADFLEKQLPRTQVG